MRIGLMLALISATAMPNVTMERTAKGYIAKVGTFDMRQQADIDAEIERRAAGLCGLKEVRWGEFNSLARLGKNPGAEPAPVTGYFKAFSCIERDGTSYQPAPSDWKANDADQKSAVTFFETYYAKRDRGDFAAAFAMFNPGVLGDAAHWTDEMAAQNKKMGPGKRRVTGATWYVNPEGAPHPGIFVAIDFVGDFPSAYVYCGYLALYRRGPGTYEITREEQNMFTHGDGTPDRAQIEQMRAGMCRGQ